VSRRGPAATNPKVDHICAISIPLGADDFVLCCAAIVPGPFDDHGVTAFQIRFGFLLVPADFVRSPGPAGFDVTAVIVVVPFAYVYPFVSILVLAKTHRPLIEMIVAFGFITARRRAAVDYSIRVFHPAFVDHLVSTIIAAGGHAASARPEMVYLR
jgi:hypothetical protein